MRSSLRSGISFGLTSGVITTLGLLVGLQAGTHSRLAVIGGVLTIAIADALSDALGMHIAKESETGASTATLWLSALSTFVSKFILAISFIVPVLAFPLVTAVWASIAYGLIVLGLLSYFIARSQGAPPAKTIGEHIAIAVIVVILTHFTGVWISRHFGEAGP